MAITHTVELTLFNVDPESGAVELHYDVDGVEQSATFSGKQPIIDQYTDPITSPLDALKELMCMWVAMDPTLSDPSLVLGIEQEISYAVR